MLIIISWKTKVLLYRQNKLYSTYSVKWMQATGKHYPTIIYVAVQKHFIFTGAVN